MAKNMLAQVTFWFAAHNKMCLYG